MKLSVIIVSYNVRDFLQLCLTSVQRASEGIKCEIIVVDNNSSDGTCHMVRSLFPGVILIPNPYNAGFARACNQAAGIASGEFILFLNPDTVVSEDSFIKCIRFMETHPEAGAIGAMMIDGYGRYLRESKRAFPSPLTSFFKMSGLSRVFPRSKLFSRYYMEHTGRDQTAEVEVLTGAFMFLRKDILPETGLFDENFFMYGEDIDLSYRINRAGYKIYYCPEIKIIHFKGESSRQNPVGNLFHFYKAMLIFAKKHFSRKDFLLFHLILKPAIYFHWALGLTRKAVGSLIPAIRYETNIPFKTKTHLILAGPAATLDKISDLVLRSCHLPVIIGMIATDKDGGISDAEMIWNQIEKIAGKMKTDDIIFSVRDLRISEIIKFMSKNNTKSLIRICFVPEGEMMIIGSKRR